MKFVCLLFAYNHERWAGDAAKAIKAQSMPFDRILVSDDGSRDRTLELIRATFGPDQRVEFASRPGENLGLVARIHEMFGRLLDEEFVIATSADDVLDARCVEL